MYEDEFGDCTSIRGRFQQYFVFGEFEDCNPWKHDYTSCVRWKHDRDKEAVVSFEMGYLNFSRTVLFIFTYTFIYALN